MVISMLRLIGSGMKIKLLNSLVHNIRTQFASLEPFEGASRLIFFLAFRIGVYGCVCRFDFDFEMTLPCLIKFCRNSIYMDCILAIQSVAFIYIYMCVRLHP